MNYQLPIEFAQKWIEALRSGKYKQGFSYLYIKTNECYCVLGVAAKCAGLSEIEIEGFNSLRAFADDKRVPIEIATFASEGLAGKVSQMNDKNISFYNIADWIEKNVELI